MRTAKENMTAFYVSESAAYWRHHLRAPDLKMPVGEFRRHARLAIDLLGVDEFAAAFRERAARLGIDPAGIASALTALEVTDG